MIDETASADAPAMVHEGTAPSQVVSTAGASEPNPKRLVVFCDGTWNDLRMPHLTNVARLAKCVKPTGMMTTGEKNEAPVWSEVSQVVYYDEGVGVTEGVSGFVDVATHYLGGAVGAGLDAKIERAYRFIVLNYNAGDEIFLFGFSRGAYTARSLCGLIRKCGVLRRTNFEKIPQAIDLYRDATPPFSPQAQSFRREFAHSQVAGPEDYTADDLVLIRECQAKAKVNREVVVVPQEIRRRGFHIRFLGLWDTVGEMGVPARFKVLSELTGKRYQFHDEKVSSLVENLRHAVAVDEIRAAFDVTPISNIHELNLEWAAAIKDKQVGDRNRQEDGVDYVEYHERPYQQRWFPGDHGAVGGGNAEPGLSSGGLLWVAQGAKAADLGLDESDGSELAEAARLAEPCANWFIDDHGRPRDPKKKDLLAQIGGETRRQGPSTLDEVHESTLERMRRDPTYRPNNLERFVGQYGVET